MCGNCDVGKFHEKFGLPTDMNPGPREVPEDLIKFRLKFLKEELKEFEDAYKIGDVAGMFDALLDMVYVAHGTSHIMGFPWNEGWQLVQSANMSKVRAQPDGSDSKRGSGWDVVKPEGWTAPDIAGLLTEYGWDNATEAAVPDPLQHGTDNALSSENSGLSPGV